MAPDGHTVVQAPHPAHRCGSTTICWRFASLRMASAEQTSTHALQPTLSFLLCALSDCLSSKILGFSYSPPMSPLFITFVTSSFFLFFFPFFFFFFFAVS